MRQVNGLEEVRDGRVLIVCLNSEDEFIHSLETVAERNKDFYVAEDLFPYLNEDDAEWKNVLDVISRKNIYFWGCGDIARKYSKNIIEKIGKMPVGYIDSFKKADYFNGIPIYLPEDIIRQEQSYIVVLADCYDEISKCMSGLGRYEKENYIWYRWFEDNDLGKCMQSVVNAKSYDYADCCRPFEFVVVHTDGYAVGCCSGLQMTFGNVLEDKHLWQSVRAKIVRLSILNKTYIFCDDESCPLKKGKNLCEVKDGSRFKHEVILSPKIVQLNIDYTCNFRCTSCRDELHIAQRAELQKIEKIGESVKHIGWLDNAENLKVAGNGEVFFSRIYKDIIFHAGIQRESIDITSNGRLLNEDILDRLKRVYKEVSIEISIDAATEETYHKIRRGGDWSILCRNLENLSKQRANGELRRFLTAYVVQRDNFREIPAFIKW